MCDVLYARATLHYQKFTCLDLNPSIRNRQIIHCQRQSTNVYLNELLLC